MHLTKNGLMLDPKMTESKLQLLQGLVGYVFIISRRQKQFCTNYCWQQCFHWYKCQKEWDTLLWIFICLCWWLSGNKLSPGENNHSCLWRVKNKGQQTWMTSQCLWVSIGSWWNMSDLHRAWRVNNMQSCNENIE